MSTKIKIPFTDADYSRLKHRTPTDWSRGEFAETLIRAHRLEGMPAQMEGWPPSTPGWYNDHRVPVLFPNGGPGIDPIEVGARLHSAMMLYATSEPQQSVLRESAGLVELPEARLQEWAISAVRKRRDINVITSEWVEDALRRMEQRLSNGLSMPLRSYSVMVDPVLYRRVQKRATSLDVSFETLLTLCLTESKP
jgi:hypothetical protein